MPDQDNKYKGKYSVKVECQECGFLGIINISRKIAVRNKSCPECNSKSLRRS